MKSIKDIQDLDPLDIAEKMTGKSYKDDTSTVCLGMALQMEKSKAMEALMDASNDTKFSETAASYLKKVTEFGFEVILKEEFEADGWDNTIIKECLYILWHKKYSILLVFDTFRGNRNGGKFYYNWSPNNNIGIGSITSSGGYHGFYWNEDFTKEFVNPEESPIWKDISWEEFSVISKEWTLKDKVYRKANNLRAVWSGDHDCREALKNNINLLAENGEFLKKWIDPPFLWLLHHGDSKEPGYDFNEINNRRMELLPDYVKQCINYQPK
jgi:hypothetical protein